jgi:hypothetical protein
MRLSVVLGVGLGLALQAAACGGKVFVDGSSGSGASGAGGGATITTSTLTAPNCETGGSCAVGSDGSCTCDGVCDQQKLQVACKPSTGGAECSCIENGYTIAVCTQPGAATCNIVGECCAQAFFWQKY